MFWNGTRWVEEPPARSPEQRRGHHPTGAFVVASLIFGLVVTTAFAARGGHAATNSTSFSGPVLVVDLDADGVVAHGDSVTFNVATNATSYPEVGVRCWQSNSWVYDGYVSYFDTWLSPSYFTLDSSNWSATLAASCSARLFYYNKRGVEQVLGTISFVVAP